MKKSFPLFVIITLFFSLYPAVSHGAGASLYLSPGSGSFFVGSTFDVSIFVNTGGENINAVQASLSFDPKKLQVASPTSGKSFIEVWIAQPTFSNTKGTLEFIGGIPTPGINTTSGLISTITFRVISPGETTIRLLDSCQVLRNDSYGTNILTSKGRGVYSLTIPPPEGPKIYSPTHPDQNKWYKNNNPTFSWETEEGITDFSYSFDQDPVAVPDSISDGNYTSVSYSEIKDGIWFFHVKAKKADVWGGASHYAVQIDTSPPAGFSLTIEPSPNTIEKQPLVFFATTDALSGINYYTIKYIDISRGREEEETAFFQEAISPYKLPVLKEGKYLVVVRAYDISGNWREETATIQIFRSGFYVDWLGIHYDQYFIPWWIIIAVLAVLLLIILILLIRKIRRQMRGKRQRLSEIEKKLTEEEKQFLDKLT